MEDPISGREDGGSRGATHSQPIMKGVLGDGTRQCVSVVGCVSACKPVAETIKEVP
jgi:hypothetical protein